MERCVLIKNDSYIPMYRQVSKIIQEKIENKEYKPGDRLHSIRDLMEQYDVSRVTAVKVLEDLVKNGFAVSKRGKGTFVKVEQLNVELLRLRSLREIQEEISQSMEIEILKYETMPIPQEIKEYFADSDNEVIHIDRIHFIEQKPIALCSIFLPKSIADFTQMSLSSLGKLSLFEYLRNHGIKVVQAKQTIKAIAADNSVSRQLNMKTGDPILFAERISYDENQKPVMCAYFSFRGDSYSYTLMLNRDD